MTALGVLHYYNLEDIALFCVGIIMGYHERWLIYVNEAVAILATLMV